jgi:signal peptidase II
VENRHLKLFYGISFFAFLTDQASKLLAMGFLREESGSFNILRYFSLTLVKNRGICFGLFSHWDIQYFVIASSFIIAFIIFFYICRLSKKNWRIQTSLGLIEGGILGNLVDRLRFGAVIDFINLHIWPVFNMADVFIVSGICILMLEHIRSKDVPGIS